MVNKTHRLQPLAAIVLAFALLVATPGLALNEGNAYQNPATQDQFWCGSHPATELEIKKGCGATAPDTAVPAKQPLQPATPARASQAAPPPGTLAAPTESMPAGNASPPIVPAAPVQPVVPITPGEPISPDNAGQPTLSEATRPVKTMEPVQTVEAGPAKKFRIPHEKRALDWDNVLKLTTGRPITAVTYSQKSYKGIIKKVGPDAIGISLPAEHGEAAISILLPKREVELLVHKKRVVYYAPVQADAADAGNRESMEQ
jgi:hypothetical protein